MARAKKCDRCGKLHEHYDGRREFKNSEQANGVILIDRDLDNKYWTRKTYDFCPDCMRKAPHSYQYERRLHYWQR